jgi:hypothetical protein
MMQKILVFTTLAVMTLASSSHVHHHEQQVEALGAWPPLNLLTTFKTDATLHTFDGKALKAYKGISATVKVDGDRNKVKVDAKV